jgi:hypothetical protein
MTWLRDDIASRSACEALGMKTLGLAGSTCGCFAAMSDDSQLGRMYARRRVTLTPVSRLVWAM